MTDLATAGRIESIPIDRISVINPRLRNRRGFDEIVASIGALGLKRPITVTRREDADGPRYDLVCGQGRLEAYQSLGESEIPALVVEADAETALVMSLVENCARRQHRAIDLFHDIEGMKRRGYSEAEIARKTALSSDYVRGVIRLIETGEHRLIVAVESGHLPVSVAVEIAGADDQGVQAALQRAYENNLLRGKKLAVARRVVEQRRKLGKDGHLRIGSGGSSPVTGEALLRAWREDVDRKRHIVRKADAARERLLFIVAALRVLIADENFVTLLRAEGLETMPKALAERLPSLRGA